MNKKIGAALALAGLVVAGLFIAAVTGYSIIPNNAAPDFTGEDKGTP